MTNKLNLALIGYGEVGQIFAREFLAGDGAAVADLRHSFRRSGGGARTDRERAQRRRASGKERRRRGRRRRDRHLGRDGGLRRRCRRRGRGLSASGTNLFRHQFRFARHQEARRRTGQCFGRILCRGRGDGAGARAQSQGADPRRRPGRRGGRQSAERARHEHHAGHARARPRLGDEALPQHHDQGNRGFDHRLRRGGTALGCRERSLCEPRGDLSVDRFPRARGYDGRARAPARHPPRGRNARGRR